MIIISNKPGQLGNLLIIYSGFICFEAEYHVKVANPAFFDYSSYFNFTNRRSKFLQRLFYFISFQLVRVLNLFNIHTKLINFKRLDWSERCNLDMPPDKNGLQGALCFVQGWQYRADALTVKHASTIRLYFTPADRFLKSLDQFFENIQKPDELLFGIHIRRGDYEHFENGRYFYSIEQYRQLMLDMESRFQTKKLHFLICSNEPIDVRNFEPLVSPVTKAPGHELLDMYALARCHYIAGPPSTFSIWASFYGQVPLYMIKEMARPFSPQDFVIANHF